MIAYRPLRSSEQKTTCSCRTGWAGFVSPPELESLWDSPKTSVTVVTPDRVRRLVAAIGLQLIRYTRETIMKSRDGAAHASRDVARFWCAPLRRLSPCV